MDIKLGKSYSKLDNKTFYEIFNTSISNVYASPSYVNRRNSR